MREVKKTLKVKSSNSIRSNKEMMKAIGVIEVSASALCTAAYVFGMGDGFGFGGGAFFAVTPVLMIENLIDMDNEDDFF